MWVVIAKSGLDKHREDIISDILDQEIIQEPDLFLKKRGSKYITTGNLSEAQFYKLESSCKKLIQRFQKSKTVNMMSHYDKFYWVKDYHISYRKVERDEWNRMCDNDINLLTQSFNHHKSMIEKRRQSFK
jgi:hypothetical protein